MNLISQQRLRCAHCNTALKLSSHTGCRIRCPNCKSVFEAVGSGYNKNRLNENPILLRFAERDSANPDHVVDHPRTIVHNRCGQPTRLPDQVVTKFRTNPFLHGFKFRCSTCDKKAGFDQLVWQETGEGLRPYFQRLRKQCVNGRNFRNQIINNMILIGLFLSTLAGLIASLLTLVFCTSTIALTVFLITAIVSFFASMATQIGIRGGI